jgi:ACR3 family arsenite efflux pump ArsB
MLNNIQKNLFWWILGSIITGLLVVKFFGGLTFSPLICLIAALIMIYPSLVPLDFSKTKQSLKQFKIIFLSFVINFILSPALAITLGYLFLPENPDLWIGLILLSILPGGGMVTTWALKSKADMPTTIGIIIFNLLAAILIVPWIISMAIGNLDVSLEEQFQQSLLMSTENETCLVETATQGMTSCSMDGAISPLKIALPVFFIVIIPLIMAFFTQKIIIKRKGQEYFQKIKSNFGQFSNLGLIIVLFLLMSLKNNIIIFEQPIIIIKLILPLTIYYGIILLVVIFIYQKFFKNNIGKAFVWGSYLRYITLALGLGISLIFQDERLAMLTIPIALSYFIQIPSSFWLAKYLKNNDRLPSSKI